MADCSQLQLLLSEAQQDRAALDHPETYCQDLCDPGDYVCIKQCYESIAQRKAADDAAIARLQDEISICETLLTTYNITAGLDLTGKLTINALDGRITPITDTGFGFTGTLQYDQDPPGGNIGIFGSWDEIQQTITFSRIFTIERDEEYKGGFGGFPPTAVAGSLAGELTIGSSEAFWQANPVSS